MVGALGGGEQKIWLFRSVEPDDAVLGSWTEEYPLSALEDSAGKMTIHTVRALVRFLYVGRWV